MARRKDSLVPGKGLSALFDRVVSILEQARSEVVRTIDNQMVLAYWQIGREIVEQEQRGETRANYGEYLIKDLSPRLSRRYGRGFSTPNLKNFRQFYLTFRNRTPQIGYTPCSQLAAAEIRHASRGESSQGFAASLGWSHYRTLMRVENEQARSFYEIEAAKGRWSVRQLDRQISSLLFERLAKSRDKDGVLLLAKKGHGIERPIDAIKDPYVLEFLDLPESHLLVESTLEEALITHLQEFLLELGTGFAFVGRQKRLTLEGDHFYPDLVFYHIRLQCYVIIDLKVAKLTPQDLGQMQMYVHYYDREIRGPQDNPTIGLLLCTDKNEAVVRYVLAEDNQQIFASRYRLELPNESQLAAEIKRELGLMRGQNKNE